MAVAARSGMVTNWRGQLAGWANHGAAKPLIFLLGLGPLAHWIWAGAQDALGTNPAETLLRGSGLWTLRLLCLVLVVTPLCRWTGVAALGRFRRMIGLFAFFYATLHFLAYAWLDQGLGLQAILRDLAKRPFALLGFTAWVLMLPLAATSFDRAIRALGRARWKTLHLLVHPAALAGLLHFVWMRASKNRADETLVYAAILALLFVARWLHWHRRKSRPAVSVA
ncbi:MAG TPA: protein-methionine-sulfoxide reductase heme-binding subunit MsrQ [Burkholderiaceae bacterium]|nr:protein-methionine-sulfoxide reductase heme-binding subunit MsrQ [Burkholderiaceae bacterium]